MREVTHRSKNLLTVIPGDHAADRRQHESIDDFETRFSRCACDRWRDRRHDLLVQEDFQAGRVDAGTSCGPSLGHYSDRVGSQIELIGDRLQIPPDAAQHIGMAMHELATNAAKIRRPVHANWETVRVSWVVSRAPEGRSTRVTSTWEESGGPPVERPARRGFGRAWSLNGPRAPSMGRSGIEYAPAGLRWTLEFPVV